MSCTYHYKTSTKSIYTIKDILSKKLYHPECQRALDPSHVEDFYQFQKNYYKMYNVFLLIHNIVLCTFENKEYIIDGQHRVEALYKLYKDVFPSETFIENTIFVTRLQASTKEELYNHFILCNKNKPLCPDVSDEQIYFYKPIEEYLQNIYGLYHKNTKSPRVPNWNIGNIVQEMKKIQFHLYITKEECIQEIEQCNYFYKKTIQNYQIDKLENKLIKSKKIQEDNYLVLSFFHKMEWLYTILYKIQHSTTYNNIPTHVHKREKIKKKVRRRVWEKRNTSLDGKCYCCNENIHYDTFECGHIVSVYCRGETKISNLEPICSGCNKNMGIRNLEEYRKELQKELQ